MQNNSSISHLFKNSLSEYPLIEGIPWAFTDFNEKFIEWSSKTQNYLAYENSLLSPIQKQLNEKQHSGLTQKRLQQYVDDKSAYLKGFTKLLKPFLENKQKTITLDKQNILSYQDLIFRDWSWGQEEINTYYSHIQSFLTGSEKNILVLGAGSCGLSYMLAQNSDANIIATDINPYLFLSAQKLVNNKSIKTYEFLDSPSDIKFYSHKTQLQAKSTLKNHFQVFCDFYDLPFKEASFDTVISCWFYDIIPTDLDVSLSHTNYFLKEDGKNIFIGPQNFHKNQISKQLVTDEIVECFKTNYSLVNFKTYNSNYLNNPNSSSSRIEGLLVICSSNHLVKKLFTKAENTSVDFSEKFAAYKQKNEIFNRILKYIDGNMSYSALASKIKDEFGFTDEESQYYAKNFIEKISSEI